MDDVISRQATYLALVEKGQASKRYKLGETWELNGKEIREVLDALPSVQPEPRTDGDTISRQAAIDAINELHDKPNAWLDLAVDALEKLPSEEPQRMRAKWIVTTSMQEGQITWRDYKCSNCSHHRGKPMNFCEVCGAIMER